MNSSLLLGFWLDQQGFINNKLKEPLGKLRTRTFYSLLKFKLFMYQKCVIFISGTDFMCMVSYRSKKKIQIVFQVPNFKIKQLIKYLA